MGQRERFILFLVGAALGVALLMAFNSRGNPQRDERKRVADALSLPGMYYDYAVQGNVAPNSRTAACGASWSPAAATASTPKVG